MCYTYDGEVHVTLSEAYQEDVDPFPTAVREFPPREHNRKEIRLLRQLLFPRIWNCGEYLDDPELVRDTIEEFGQLCCLGIRAYGGSNPESIARDVVEGLPAIRQQLKKDVTAAYKGDPAAKSYAEIIRAYPGLHAILVHRIAHRLYTAGVKEYARELAESAHSETGIDIHPGASVGDYFFVDHGTGVVIGETATVGDWVRIYQGVTLGALHFEEDEDEEHLLKKDYKRHPDIGDHVVIGSGSNVMGPIDIGDHVSIGANSWITDDIPEYTTVYVSDHPKQEHKSTD